MDVQILDAFTDLKCLQQAKQINEVLKEAGLSWEDYDALLEQRVTAHHEEKKEREEEKRVITQLLADAKIKRCSDCGAPMRIWPVNDSKATMVDGGYQSQWFCKKCGFTEFSDRLPEEEIALYEKEGK